MTDSNRVRVYHHIPGTGLVEMSAREIAARSARNARHREAHEKIRSIRVARRAKFDAVAEKVPPGRYALRVVQENEVGNDYAFYHVRRDRDEDEGVTVDRQLGPKTNRVPRNQRLGILERITKMGPGRSARLYGRLTGYCWMCGHALTNKRSRALGIGPDCRREYL